MFNVEFILLKLVHSIKIRALVSNATSDLKVLATLNPIVHIHFVTLFASDSIHWGASELSRLDF